MTVIFTAPPCSFPQGAKPGSACTWRCHNRTALASPLYLYNLPCNILPESSYRMPGVEEWEAGISQEESLCYQHCYTGPKMNHMKFLKENTCHPARLQDVKGQHWRKQNLLWNACPLSSLSSSVPGTENNLSIRLFVSDGLAPWVSLPPHW